MLSDHKQKNPDLQLRNQKSERRYSAFLFVPAYIFFAWLILFHLYMAEPIIQELAGDRCYENLHKDGIIFADSADGLRNDLGTVDIPLPRAGSGPEA